MTDAKAETDVQGDAEADCQALLFEFENVAIAGRKVAYDVHKSLFADRGIDLTPAMFMRYCLQDSGEEQLQRLLDDVGKTRLSASKLASEISEGIRLSFEDTGVKLTPGVGKMLKKMAADGVALGAVSITPHNVSERIGERLGLKDLKMTVLSMDDEDRDKPSADSWLKLGKEMGVSQGRCTALVTSTESCKAALSAGMRTIVVPDEFTSFQDFGGADLVVDGDVDAATGALMDIVRPA